MTAVSVLLPEQPHHLANVQGFADLVGRSANLRRLWLGQSFGIESHMALSMLAGRSAIPVAIGTALAVLRSPFDAALQARSLALALDQEVSVGYGAADPDFVASVRGRPFERPASYTAEYCRLVRALVQGERATSDEPGVEMDAMLPPCLDHSPVRVGAGVLRAGMARRAAPHVDFAVSWLTPPSYLAAELIPALARAASTRPEVSTFVACAVARPGRDPRLIAQYGVPHLRRAHYVDMLQRAGLDVDLRDTVSSARELVESGVFVYGSPADVASRLSEYAEVGIEELVLNVTPVALVHGIEAALEDVVDVVAALDSHHWTTRKRTTDA